MATTSFQPGGYPGRAYGSFEKEEVIVVLPPAAQYAVGGGGKQLNLNDLEVFRYVDKRMKEGVEVEEILRELRKEKVPEPAKPAPGRRVVLEKPKLPATVAPETLRMLNDVRELSRDARELEQVIRLSIQQEFLTLSQEQEAARTLKNQRKAALLLLIAGTM